MKPASAAITLSASARRPHLHVRPTDVAELLLALLMAAAMDTSLVHRALPSRLRELGCVAKVIDAAVDDSRAYQAEQRDLLFLLATPAGRR